MPELLKIANGDHNLLGLVLVILGFPGGSVAKNLPANARDAGDMGLIPGSERVFGVGNGSPLKYSRLKNSRDREAWRATVHGVAESNTAYIH